MLFYKIYSIAYMHSINSVIVHLQDAQIGQKNKINEYFEILYK